MNDWIISRAHEWVGPTKMGASDVKCKKCGIVTLIGQWNIPRCVPHNESIESGWLPE